MNRRQADARFWFVWAMVAVLLVPFVAIRSCQQADKAMLDVELAEYEQVVTETPAPTDTVKATFTTHQERNLPEAKPPVRKTTPRLTTDQSSAPHRSGLKVSLGTFEATAYCLTGHTKSGMHTGPGRIAVDPRVIPLGTRLYVEGYGYCVAADTGDAVKGRAIDVWFASRSKCLAWGRRHVHVWRLE